MSKHEITVTLPVEITFVIDDTKVSDWKGYSLLQAHEDGERWAAQEPIQRDLALVYMAQQIFERDRLGGTDGWADFPEDATENVGWPSFSRSNADVFVRQLP